MLNLMRQEVKRNNIRTYLKAVLGSFVGLIVFTYFIAYVAEVENEIQFQNYANIFIFVVIMCQLSFSILSATMYTKFIINEYCGARLALLFSYPISRKKILVSKLAVVMLFTATTVALTLILIILLFLSTEKIYPIVNDTISLDLIIVLIRTGVICVFSTICTGLLSMRIGFIWKSVPSTLISSFLIAGLLGNLTIGASENNILSMGLVSVLVLIMLVVILELSNKVNRMEVE